MSISILINTDKLTFLKASEADDSVRRLEIWAEILIPKDGFIITGDNKRNYSAFTMMELKMLYRNTTDKELATEDYSRALDQVLILAERVDLDTLTEKELLVKLGKPMPIFSTEPAEDKGASTAKRKAPTSGELPKRPKAGTATATVWDIADTQFKHKPTQGTLESREFKTYVIDMCVMDGINKATAQVQFGKWKKVQEGSN